MPKCAKCDDTGVIETGNKKPYCDCIVGANAILDDDDLPSGASPEDGGEA